MLRDGRRIGCGLSVCAWALRRVAPEARGVEGGKRPEAVLPRHQEALEAGQSVLVLGPWCYGLFTGTQAFASTSEATDFVRLQGLSPERWQIYQASGDYQLDVTDGVLNKTLQLVRPLPFTH